MHFFNKKIFNFKTFLTILKVFFVILVLLFLIFVPRFIFNKESYTLDIKNLLSKNEGSKIVLNLYHIETFEGGTNSREDYLKKCALSFNKQNKSAYIIVNTLTPHQLVINLRNNNLPDIFSFGYGVGEYLGGFLKELNKNKVVRQDLLEYAKFNEKILAYPYILSGYSLISYENLTTSNNKRDYFEVSLSSGTNSLKALSYNNFDVKEENLNIKQTGFDAYVDFINKKSKSLVGTLRDVARISQREKLNTISSVKYEVLSGFSDLVQYISVVKTNIQEKEILATEFCNFLLEKTQQENLKNYGLLPTTSQKIYSEGYMSDFEDKLKGKLVSLNVFSKK